MTDAEAKSLEAALELFRKQLTDDPFHQVHNASRQQADDPAEWTKGFANLFAAAAVSHGAGGGPAGWSPAQTPRAAPSTYNFAEGDTYEVKPPERRPEDPRPVNPAFAGVNIPQNPFSDRSVMPATESVSGRPVVITGHTGAPIPVFIVGDKQDYAADRKNRPDPRIEPWEKDEGGKPGAKKKPAKETAVADALISRFAIILGPLTAFSQILGSANSGFSVFMKSVGVFSSVMSPVLMPAFVLLAAAIITVSDEIWSHLLPALREWYEWLDKHKGEAGQAAGGVAGIAAAFGLGKLLNAAGGVSAGGALKGGASKLALPFLIGASVFDAATGDYYAGQRGRGGSKVGSGLAALGGGFMNALSQPLKWTGIIDKSFGEAYSDKFKDQIKQFRGSKDEGGQGGDSGPKSTPFGGGFNEALRDVIKSVGLSLGPKGSYSALTEVGKQAQLAAINSDPLEARSQRATIDILTLLQQTMGKKVESTEPPPARPLLGPGGV